MFAAFHNQSPLITMEKVTTQNRSSKKYSNFACRGTFLLHKKTLLWPVTNLSISEKRD